MENIKNNKIVIFKEMTRGMKILVIILWVALFFGFFNVLKNFESSRLFLGFQTKFPLSFIISFLLWLITPLTLVGIYKMKWWKFLLVIRGLSLVDFFISIIYLIITPISKTLALSGVDTSNYNQDYLQHISLTVKLFTATNMIVGFIIGIIIWVYIYKNKKYFYNNSQEVNIEPNITNITN